MYVARDNANSIRGVFTTIAKAQEELDMPIATPDDYGDTVYLTTEVMADGTIDDACTLFPVVLNQPEYIRRIL